MFRGRINSTATLNPRAVIYKAASATTLVLMTLTFPNNYWTSWTESSSPSSDSPNGTDSSSLQQDQKSTKQPAGHVGVIEADLFEKLASKPYLNYHNKNRRDSVITLAIQKFRRKNIHPNAINNSFDDFLELHQTDAGESVPKKDKAERPRGVPRRMRVLVIDVPEFRQVIDGECRVNLARVFRDDVAPRKRVRRKLPIDSSKNRKNLAQDQNLSTKNMENKSVDMKTKDGRQNDRHYMEIAQKSLARSLVRCRNASTKHIGVELLEASVFNLNPNNLRRTFQVGAYKYDPVKYTTAKLESGENILQHRYTSKDTDHLQAPNSSTHGNGDIIVENESKIKNTDIHHDTSHHTVENDEMHAPWNQYAWIEELHMRIHGYIPFGAATERSSFLSRWIFGNCYRTTIRSSNGWFSWFIPSFFKGIYCYHDLERDGIDGDHDNVTSIQNIKNVKNRASSKPHAVIADASAMQRVPGSLRILSNFCKEADVPLFIINDPRAWGGNKHADLETAARDMRRAIKARVVARALLIKEGGMFERGRILGNLEAEAQWQAKDLGRRTRQAVQDAINWHKKKREDDWEGMTADELLQRFVERRIVVLQLSEGNVQIGNDNQRFLVGEAKDGKEIYYSEEFMEVCKMCLGNYDRKQMKKDTTSS